MDKNLVETNNVDRETIEKIKKGYSDRYNLTDEQAIKLSKVIPVHYLWLNACLVMGALLIVDLYLAEKFLFENPPVCLGVTILLIVAIVVTYNKAAKYKKKLCDILDEKDNQT